MERAIETGTENLQRSANYFGREDIRFYQIFFTGKPRQISWTTSEASVVEGAPYFRLTAINGRKLSKKQEQAEQRKLERATAERRQRKLDGQPLRSTDSRWSVDLRHLLKFHDLERVGEDTIARRKMLVVEARLREEAPAPVGRNDLALAGNLRLWIDAETGYAVRRLLEVTRSWGEWREGSLVEYQLFREEGIYLLEYIRVTRRVDHARVRAVETEQRYSQYRKFTTDSSITFEPTP